MWQEKLLAKWARIANIILGGGGVVCVFVVSYFVYNYSWTGQRQFTSSIGIILYYVFPAVLAGLLFASLRLRPSQKVNFAILCFSLVVSIYAAESFLSFSNFTPSGSGVIWGGDQVIKSYKYEI